jgi:hypothetical protein
MTVAITPRIKESPASTARRFSRDDDRLPIPEARRRANNTAARAVAGRSSSKVMRWRMVSSTNMKPAPRQAK